MQLMDSKRPSGRAAVVLAGLLSLTCGWMAIASAPERETVAATQSEDNAPIVVTWQVADALIELGMLQVEEYAEHGGAVATLAASGGSGLSVVVVTGIEGDVIAQVQPPIAPPGPCNPPTFFPGPGDRCIGPSWRLFDYPPGPQAVGCKTGWFGSVKCTYEYKFVFLRRSTDCEGCAQDQICVEYAQYIWKCEERRSNEAQAPDCRCPDAPLSPDAGGTCIPTLPPLGPGISPGQELRGWDMKTGKKCYTPGKPWGY
jgi:hypothetical protein